MNTRRRLDRLARHVVEARHSAATTTGGRCNDDPAHVAQVLATLAECGALETILERAGLAGMVDPYIRGKVR